MKNRPLLIALLLLHGTVSTLALYRYGLVELFAFAVRDLPQFQIFVDLTVAAVLLNAFLIRDAKTNGRNPWPFVFGTLLLGSFSPLLYFVIGAFARSAEGSRAAGPLPPAPGA